MQTTTKDRFDVAVPGMVYDSSWGPRDVISCVAEEDIPFGVLVELGDGARIGDSLPAKVAEAGLTSSSILGISQYRPTKGQRLPVTGVVPALIQAGDVFNVVRKGRVWAYFTGATAADFGTDLQVNIETATKGHLTAVAADANNLATGLKAYGPAVGALIVVEMQLPPGPKGDDGEPA